MATLDDPRVRAALERWRPQPSIRRRLATPFLVASFRLIIQVLNSVELQGVERFEEARAMDRGLLTFSNHVSLFDDPWLVSTFSGFNWDRARWCATDALNFFDHPLVARFFSVGKGVPIVRGAGIDQPGMQFLEQKLLDGEWVHIFPEGTRSRVPRELASLKTGIGHLVRATKPLLLPFHHQGMEEVLPIGARFPRFGKKVRLKFGELVDSRDGLCDQSVEEITAWAEQVLLELQRSWDEE